MQFVCMYVCMYVLPDTEARKWLKDIQIYKPGPASTYSQVIQVTGVILSLIGHDLYKQIS
jgi:hypothetical protein